MATANKIMLVNDRVERAKSFLLTQFKDKPNINALVDALVSELQELENVINDVQTVRTLEGSYGWWTDQIGNELDLSRGNYADNDFKTAIKIAMAKQTASASVDDILRIVSLLTDDLDAKIYNRDKYLLELYSLLSCISDSPDGLESLGKIFPLNTRVRMVKHDVKPIVFNQVGSGIAVDTTISDLAYHKYGNSEDPRFVTLATQDIPPPLSSAPAITSAPYIYGDNTLGSVITLVRGTYSGDTPLTYTYQWMRDGFNISGATALTYTLISGDEGKAISCSVTVSNASGNLVATTNSILVSTVVPPASTIKSDLGLDNLYGITYHPYDNTTANATVTLTIRTDGTVAWAENGALTNNTWAVTPAAGVGNGYRVYYEVVSGETLANLNPNAHHTLSSNITLELSVSSKFSVLHTGEYKFYIYEIANPANVATKTITITAEIVGNL